MIVETDNRFARAMNYPDRAANSIALVTDVSAPGSDYQNASYGLGSVFSDITGGNFANLPSSIIAGLNPSTFDIGSYLVVGALAMVMVPLIFKGGAKARARATRRKATLKGRIAMDQELLKSA